MTTVQWALRLCTAVGVAVVGTALFLALAWVFRPRQGYWRTRRWYR